LGVGESVSNFIFLQTKNSLSGVINPTEDFCTHILNGNNYIPVAIAQHPRRVEHLIFTSKYLERCLTNNRHGVPQPVYKAANWESNPLSPEYKSEA
jgi:hypothetical protein